jgi:CheY-like chemotaxis protein
VTDAERLQELAERFGVPGVDLEEISIPTEQLGLIPREVCEAHHILPLLVRGDQVFLAMENPNDRRAIDELEFVTGRKVYPYVVLPEALKAAIAAAHAAREQDSATYVGPRAPVDDKRPTLAAPPPPGTREARAPDQRSADEVLTGVLRPRKASRPSMQAVDAPPSGDEISDDDLIEVEVEAPAPEPEVRGAGGQPSASNKLVLVVDDEEEIRTMLKRVLRAQGHLAIEADSGPAALQMVKHNLPDLIILDAMLPGVHGFDVARRLKGSDRYGAIPIIMISAVYRGWRVAEDLKASYGIFDYVEKPFRLNDIIDAVTRGLASRSGAASSATRDLDALSAEATKALDDGVHAYRAGDLDGAITLLQTGTKVDPLSYRLHYHLALLYARKKRVFDGIRELEISVEINPKYYPALKNLALLYEQAGFRHRAIEVWERAVHVAPDPAAKAQVKERLFQLL